MISKRAVTNRYYSLLQGFVCNQDESLLTEAFQLGRDLVAEGLPLECIVEIHVDAMDILQKNKPDLFQGNRTQLSTIPLIETLMSYSMAFRAQLEVQMQTQADLLRNKMVLNKTIKQLNCLYNCSKVYESVDLSLDESLRKIGNLIPSAFKYPELTYVKIILKDKEYITEEFLESDWKLKKDIVLSDRVVGSISIYCSKKSSENWRESFLVQKMDFLDAIIELLERIIERHYMGKERTSIMSQLIQSQKMESIGRLTSGIAHDFNNMLTTIVGFSESILDEMDEDNQYYHDIKEINKTGYRARHLTNQLLISSRKSLHESKVLNITELIKERENMIRRILGSEIQLVLDLDPDLSHIQVDPSQFDQIVMNLIVNARDAMPVGGRVTIETTNVVIDEDIVQPHISLIPGDYVALVVRDTGRGMDEETKSRILKPFFTTKEEGKGTGMGLSIVSGIVKQHNGYIMVNSKPSEGASFRIVFPVVLQKVVK